MRGREVLKFLSGVVNSILVVVVIITVVAVLSSLSGCSSTIETLKEPEFKNGCVVVETGIKLGYINQEGQAEACKLKCSSFLPEGFYYSYENQRTGCKAKIGNAN